MRFCRGFICFPHPEFWLECALSPQKVLYSAARCAHFQRQTDNKKRTCRFSQIQPQRLWSEKAAYQPLWDCMLPQAYYTVFYQYIPPLYAVTWVAFSLTELIVSISSLPVLPSNRRVNRMGWSKGGFISTALLST